jgi:DNA-binding SARP family transcriptional activator
MSMKGSVAMAQESDMPRTPETPRRLHLRLADALQVEREGQPSLPLALRDAALLAWLVVEGPTPRARLAALFWPASSELRARAALRQRLFQLKSNLGADLAEGTPFLRLAAGVSLERCCDWNRCPSWPTSA